MTQGIGSLTPLTAIVETRVFTFDFGSMWAKTNPSLTVSDIVSVTCKIAPSSQTNDPAPMSRLIGPAVVTSSPTTGLDNQAVAQQIGNLIPGVKYYITCVVQASDTSEAVLWQYLTSDQAQ
jgi:hypothetical protein